MTLWGKHQDMKKANQLMSPEFSRDLEAIQIDDLAHATVDNSDLGSEESAKVHVRIMNRLGYGRNLNIHCRSRDDDFGFQILRDGYETEWRFSINIWGTTLFYCDVQWDNSMVFHFDAYSTNRDLERCQTECRWMISQEGMLYGYNQKYGNWEKMINQES
ncbi:hypothetical protein HHK36_019947 [Tetracentron sinense]|uniref:S-protein homolog n=1 Tax=Tetracentron sinense TaxID=13715 RepID=A0A834YQS9_TETSI|nr:hypothetical protein HHK36_019947 [Tetracentron sinense]